MRIKTLTLALCLFVPLAAAAQHRATYSWYDDEGIKHYGDSVPAEFADKPKQVFNEHGVQIGTIAGKKTEEQLAAEATARELQVQKDMQQRADTALLTTYATVNEIEMHRDRRVELFQAQARVTELYLRNLRRRLDQLQGTAGRFKPYSSDPRAGTVDPSLVEEIQDTELSITRHESNLSRFRNDEKRIIDRFEGDIQRFMALKGLAKQRTEARPKPKPQLERLAQAVPE